MSKRRKRPPSPAPRYKVGDRVRVKLGVRDEDNPDLPLGGWAGTVTEVHKRGLVTVRWSRETLASIHPIYKKRCVIDGASFEEYYLQYDDLEPDLDPGAPLAIEQPARIVPRPLSPKDQADRVRMVFALTSDDFLPDADEESLETYYDYLAERLTLPAEARYTPWSDFDAPPPRRVTVVALDREIAWDEDEGILCTIRTADGEDAVPLKDLEFRSGDGNRKLTDDFATWFAGELSVDEDELEDDLDDEDEDDDDEEDDGDLDEDRLEHVTWRDLALVLLEFAAFGAWYGVVMAATLAAMPWARWGACIGGAVWGLVIALAADRDFPVTTPRFRRALDVLKALIAAAGQGALFGVLVVAFIGSAIGGIAGYALRRLLGKKRRVAFRVFPGTIVVGAACGGVAESFYRNPVAAGEWIWMGAVGGLGGALGILLFGLLVEVLTAWKSK